MGGNQLVYKEQSLETTVFILIHSPRFDSYIDSAQLICAACTQYTITVWTLCYDYGLLISNVINQWNTSTWTLCVLPMC